MAQGQTVKGETDSGAGIPVRVDGRGNVHVFLNGWDYEAGIARPLATVESATYPGVFGLLVLNADGSEVSGGGSSPSSLYGSGLYGSATYA